MQDAYSLTQTLNGHWYRTYGTAACPVCHHDARRDQDALTIRDGDRQPLPLHCKKHGCDSGEIARAIEACGWSLSYQPLERLRPVVPDRKQQFAMDIWANALPARGTIVETYFEARGMYIPVPETLRFSPSLRHPGGQYFPAMIAKIKGQAGMGVHRTYLRHDGRGNAEVDPSRAMLGSVTDGAVRLTQGTGPLIVAEGIETALAYEDFCNVCRDLYKPRSRYENAQHQQPW